MQNVETYPHLRNTRVKKCSSADLKRSVHISLQSNNGNSQFFDRLGFSLLITSTVAILIICSFYLMAKQPDRKAILMSFRDINLALEESYSESTYEEANPLVISYKLPSSFAAVRTDPRASSEYNQYLTQIRFISRVIQRVTKKPLGNNLAQIIVKESKKHGYDPLFVTAVIMAESGFNKKAISSVGAMGLMQLLPSTAKYIAHKLGAEHWKGHRPLLHDESYNIKLGVTYLKYLGNKFGDDKKTILAAYNWGPGNVERSIKRGSTKLPSETVRYRDSIMRNYSKWSSELRQQQVNSAAAKANLLG
jgi:soluble lytic murein transglycosylase-like protein